MVVFTIRYIWKHFDPNAQVDATHIDGLVQERRNSSALAMELRLSCTNPSICYSSISWDTGLVSNKLLSETGVGLLKLC